MTELHGPEFAQWEKSRTKILTLNPLVQRACIDHVTRAALEGIWLLVPEALRTSEYQRTLWLKGRDAAGNIVDKSKVITYAPPGSSVHEYGFAYDVAPDGVTVNEFGLTPEEAMVDGKASWPNPAGKKLELWKRIVACGIAVGMRSGSTFKSIQDWPHFEWLDGLTVADLRAGKKPKRPPDWQPEEFPLTEKQ